VILGVCKETTGVFRLLLPPTGTERSKAVIDCIDLHRLQWQKQAEPGGIVLNHSARDLAPGHVFQGHIDHHSPT
jgi:hypothetical protein